MTGPVPRGRDGKGDRVTVAPREISDLVYRISRCAGCSSGTADLIAENVRFGEVFYGGAIEVFLAAVANIANDSSEALAIFSDAPSEILNAEVTRTYSVVLGQPAPLAAFGATLWQAAQRGWVATDLDHGSMTASDEFSELDFSADPPPAGCHDAVAAVDLARSVAGVDVDAGSFAQLYEGAKAFLVAEAVLDAAVPDE